MKTIIDIWNTLIQSNTFNFLVMVYLFYYLNKKFNLSNMISKLVQNIENSINSAKNENDSAIDKLNHAKDSVKGLETEIAERIDNAKKQAAGNAKNISEQAQVKIKQIEENAINVVKSEEKIISEKLLVDTASQSTDLATEKIKKILDENPDIHNKLINRSIEELI